MDKNEIMSKYVAFCGKLYDKVSTFWGGKQEQTAERIKKCQTRGTWIVSLFIVFAIIGSFMDDEENTGLEGYEETADVASGETSPSNGDVSKLGKPKSFSQVIKSPLSWFPKSKDGEAMIHDDYNLTVVSVDDDGVIVQQDPPIGGELKIGFVRTPDKGYVDGDHLIKGVYVKAGTYKYVSADGAARTVPAFEKVTREKDLFIFKAMLNALKQQED